MLNKIVALAALTALTVLLAPSRVDAWGAARVGYAGGYRAGGVAVGGYRAGGYAGGAAYRGGYAYVR